MIRYYLALLLLLPTTLFAKKEGQERIDSLVQGLPSMKEDSNKVKILCAISFLSYEYSPEKGISYGEVGKRLATKINWKPGIARALNAIGANYQVKGDRKNSITCFENSLKINEELNDKNGVAQNLGNLAIVYSDEGNLAKALEYLFRTLKIFEEMKDTAGINIQLSNIGMVYDEQRDFAKALYYDTMVLRKFKEAGDKERIASQLGNIGNVYQEMGQIDSAIYYLLEAEKLYEALGSKGGIARNLMNLSSNYSRRKEYYKALESQFKALAIYKELNHQLGVGVAEMNVGTYYFKIAKDSATIQNHALVPRDRKAILQLAASHTQHALDILEPTGNISEISYASQVMAEVKKMQGNFKDALEHYIKYSVLKDSIFSLESNKKIANIENERALDVKESKIKILEQENNLKDLRATKETLTRRILIGSIALVMIVAFSVIMYFVRKQRNEKLLANEKINTLLKEQELRSVSNMLEVQEQERKRIAADLHDRLGSMLSTVKLYFNSVEEQLDNMKQQNKEQYHKATSLLDNACDEVRKISHNLVSGELVKFGLVSALNQLRETITDAGQLKMAVLAFGMEERMDTTIEISLYRVIQELMNNILKHSRATDVTIQLNKVENNLNIVVEDNGVGYDVDTAREKDGMGLRNMETRVKKLNGTIVFDSAKGRGATTIIDIPVKG